MTLKPTLPGHLDGIVDLDPPTVQCSGCGATHTARTIGLAVLGSGMRFHHGDNRRLCLECRRAEYPDCLCMSCDEDRINARSSRA